MILNSPYLWYMQVNYTGENGSLYKYWSHLDNTAEVALYNSEVGNRNESDDDELPSLTKALSWICKDCTFENDGDVEYCEMCQAENQFAVGNLVQVYDTNMNEWMWGNVKNKSGLYIMVSFVGLQKEYDEQIHVIKDKERLRSGKSYDDIEDEKRVQRLKQDFNHNQRKRKRDRESSSFSGDEDGNSNSAKRRKLNEDEQVQILQENEYLKDEILALNTKLKGIKPDNIDKIDLLEDKELDEVETRLRNKLKVIRWSKEKIQMNYDNNDNKQAMDMDMHEEEDEDDDVLIKDNKNLKQQIVGLKASLTSKDDEEIIGMLNMEELNILEEEIKKKLKQVHDAKKRLMEDKTLCIVCLDRQKTVFITDCGHFDLCTECMMELPNKICPRCQKPFEDYAVM